MIKQLDKVWLENSTKEGRIVDEVAPTTDEDGFEVRNFKVRLNRKMVILTNEEFICLHDGERDATECPLSYDSREEWIAANV